MIIFLMANKATPKGTMFEIISSTYLGDKLNCCVQESYWDSDSITLSSLTKQALKKYKLLAREYDPSTCRKPCPAAFVILSGLKFNNYLTWGMPDLNLQWIDISHQFREAAKHKSMNSEARHPGLQPFLLYLLNCSASLGFNIFIFKMKILFHRIM